MADHIVAGSDVGVHATLAPDTADTITYEHVPSSVEILNRTGSDAIYVAVDGSDATVGGANCHVLPAAICALKLAVTQFGTRTGEAIHVSLISESAEDYSVSRA